MENDKNNYNKKYESNIDEYCGLFSTQYAQEKDVVKKEIGPRISSDRYFELLRKYRPGVFLSSQELKKCIENSTKEITNSIAEDIRDSELKEYTKESIEEIVDEKIKYIRDNELIRIFNRNREKIEKER